MASGVLLRIYLECSKEGVTRSDVILRERSPEHSEGEATEESNDEGRFRAEPVLSVMRFFAEPVLSVMGFFATLRMTGSEGLRMTGSEGLRMTGQSYGKG